MPLSHIPFIFSINTIKGFPILFKNIPPDVISQDGRPLMESRSLLHKPSELDFRTCPYSDYRKGLKINQEAYVSIRKNKNQPELASYLIELKNKNLTRFEQAFALSILGFKSLEYHIAKSIISNTSLNIKCDESKLYKICQGMIVFFLKVDLEENQCSNPSFYKDVFNFLLSEKLLHRDDEACPARATDFNQFFELFENQNIKTEHEDTKSIIQFIGLSLESDITYIIYLRNNSGNIDNNYRRYTHNFTEKLISALKDDNENRIYSLFLENKKMLSLLTKLGYKILNREILEIETTREFHKYSPEFLSNHLNLINKRMGCILNCDTAFINKDILKKIYGI